MIFPVLIRIAIGAFLSLTLYAAENGANAEKDAEKPKSKNSAAKNAADDLASTHFFMGPIQRFEITLTRGEMNKLNSVQGWGGPKLHVSASVQVGTNMYEKVSLHLKGAAGSFRSVSSGNPAFTLNFGKLNDAQKFHGMRKIHLNNSLQDPSRLSELFCGEIYRRAGVPATRATHALVSLNGKDLGLYVLKEGFDKPFLRRNFGDASGNLYDGGFVQDVDNDLERDSGDGPETRKDLRDLAEAALEGDPTARLNKLEKVLDIDRFLTLSALQFLFDDWDGYIRNRNNYRIYHDPRTDKMVFLPHGMDQMFETPNSPLLRPVGGLVARQVFSIPGMKGKLLKRVGELTNSVFTMAALDEVLAAPKLRLQEALADRGREADIVARQGQGFRSRVAQRLQKVTAGATAPLKFDSNNSLELAKFNWAEHLEGAGADLSRQADQGKSYLAIRATQPSSVGSFRTTLRLEPGVYRLEATAKASNVRAVNSTRGTGAGVRISGDRRANRLMGTTDWRLLSHDFELEEPGEVVLVLELRANEGDVAFDLASAKLRRL